MVEIPIAAATAFAEDYASCVYHVLRDTEGDYRWVPAASVAALMESVERCELPSLDVLNTLVAAICWETTYNQQHPRRPASPEEQRVAAIAWRWSDALNNGVRVAYVPHAVSALSPGTD